MKKLLFVVHRYAPYPGGSENYVRDLAEESFRQGNDITVFTGQHKGHLNGIKVTSDASVLNDTFDLIIIHGGDVDTQNFVLSNASKIKSPILYMLILPSNSKVCVKALNDVKYIGCSTIEDWEHVNKYNVKHKSIQISHSIDPRISNGKPGFKEKYNIKTSKMFLCSGGFWPHKGMEELSIIFNKLPIRDTTLVLTGYQNKHLMPKSNNKIKVMLLEDRQEMLNALKEADLYIMSSIEEGFGLVLLESMLNKTPWVSREIAGAKLMKEHGYTFNSKEELMKILYNFKKDDRKIQSAYEYLINNHTIEITVKQMLNLLG